MLTPCLRASNLNEKANDSPPWAALPGSALVAILRQCDEPTRYSASQVCQAWAEAVPEARRDDYRAAAERPGRWTREMLPTATELADRGCPRPHWGNIAKTMRMSTSVGQGPLRQFYMRSIGLEQAQKSGYIFAAKLNLGRYIGGGADQTREGFGIQAWANGRRYEGDWRADQPDGHGVCTWADGERYEGGYEAGRPDGHGVFTWADGGRYEGGYKAGQPDGHGVFTWADGGRYEGGYKAGKKDGHGVYTWADGTRYEGSYKAGQLDGHGIQTPTLASNQALIERLFTELKKLVS